MKETNNLTKENKMTITYTNAFDLSIADLITVAANMQIPTQATKRFPNLTRHYLNLRHVASGCGMYNRNWEGNVSDKLQSASGEYLDREIERETEDSPEITYIILNEAGAEFLSYATLLFETLAKK